MSASDALACVAVAVAVELAGASDLLRHPSPSGDPGRWLALLAFCAAVLSQAALSVAYRIPKRYYRMLPVSFATYSSHACAPLLAASAASLSPLLYGIAARCPDRLPGALLFVAAFSIAPFAIAENRESSRAVAALSLLAFGIAVAVLSAILPIAAYAAASFAVLLALGHGRRHFLRDEVLE
jgi:hypothetical protein